MDNQNTAAGSTLVVPIRVDSVGNEAGYTFSIAFDSTKLTTPQVAIGNAGGDVAYNTNTAGQIGFSVSAFSGGTIVAGNNLALVNVTFTVAGGASPGTTSITFTDAPAKRKTSGIDPNTPLTQPTYTNGTISIPEASSTVLDASASGRTVTLGADVLPATASGTLEFFEGPSPLGKVPVASGHATLALSDVSPGPHTYTAVFTSSNAQVSGSTSTARSVTVAPVGSTTALAARSTGSTVDLGAAVTTDPDLDTTGSVTFFEGPSSRGTRSVVSGHATLTLSNVSPGAHSYTAVYTSTNPQVTGSTSAARTVRVAAPVKVASRTSLVAPANAFAGTRPFLKITVKRGTAAATGKVRMVLAGKQLATVTLRAGKASYQLPRLTVGRKNVKVLYLGNATTTVSQAVRTITVTKR